MRIKVHRSVFLLSFVQLFMLLAISRIGFAQPSSSLTSSNQIGNLKETLNASGAFIENIGQYGNTMTKYERMGSIRFGYEGLDMPVLFTPRGLIHLQRKIQKISRREEERLERQGISEAEIEKKRVVTERVIVMEWVGADPEAKIIAEQVSPGYHTYGRLNGKALGYNKLIYKNMYPGIDIEYSFAAGAKAGFEYSLLVQPGADISVVKMKYGGDIISIKKDARGKLLVRSDINGIEESVPVSLYSGGAPGDRANTVTSSFTVSGTEIGFGIAPGYDKTKTLVIDPFVTATSNLDGVNSGKAKDVDFDYAGNIYVTGGGSATQYKLAKYNSSGVLQWTFNGSTTNPAWTFGPYYGGWVVDKNSGNIYLGQGFNPGTGYQVIRISTTGLYDNYISAGNIAFNENWKMYWNCNSGSPRILVVGGGTSSNLNLGILTPPSTTITPLNLTGIGTVCQDMVDMVLDPTNNDIYTLFASLFVTPSINNKIYKNTAPYSSASIAWNVPSGFSVVQEAGNRPYMAPISATYDDNSANMLSLNASYLFYWDGKNLKAFDRATGAGVGTPLITANTAKMQGGIIADACNNIFVGEGNGVIKVYNFNGSVFNDAPADIPIPGFSGKAVYDLAYDELRKLIYASGDGFVASFDVSAYCPATTYTINVVPNCLTSSAVASITPAPPGGSTITYTLFNGTTQVSSNTTGIFTGLIPATTYTITATVNLACSGTQATASFVLPGPAVGITHTNTTCGANTGTITATGSGTPGPYTYSIDGTNFFASGLFTGLAAGVYTVTVKDANGCRNTGTEVILNSNGPALTSSQTNATCGSNNGTITANVSGGTAPYQYSINGTTFQSGNIFTGLAGGIYTLTVRDAANCTNATVVTISSTPSPFITAIPAAATCGSNNGTITAFGSGGTAPLQYSINGNIYQAGNVFPGVTAGTYTVYVKDANNCLATTVVTVANSAAPTVSATSTPAVCANTNGTITATGSGGIAPLQYSIDGITFQTSNVFTGLAAGTYTITIKDATNCSNITSVVVASTGGPGISAVSTASSCASNTGTITITGTGTPVLQYSINGTSYVATNVFTALAPGNYIAYVKDGAGCISAVPVTVAATAGPSITVIPTPSSCNVNDGTLTANASGGTPPYLYSLDGITYTASSVFTGLAPGSYTVYVKDNNNCIKTTSATVLNASGLTLAVSVINSSCNTNSGTITATATGNAPPLQYSIDGTTYQASNVFTGLAAGNYTVYVRDNNNCVVTKPAAITAVTGASLNVTSSNATCAGNNGIINAVATGGVSPLTYSINGTTYQSSGVFINVAPGAYTVYVKDAANCITTQPVTITTSGTGPGITTFTVVTKFYPCDGDVTGRITNPRVNGANCGSCTFSLDFGVFIPNAAQLFTNVPQGIHYVTAKDANGCTKTIQVNMVPTPLSTASTVITGSACNATNGSIALTGSGINTPFHASITGLGGPWITFDPSYTFTGLAPGVYDILLADDASFTSPPDNPGGCVVTITVIVPSIGGPSISTLKTPGTCAGTNGTITASASGGAGGYTYNINGGAYQVSGVFNNLAPGIYLTGVLDASGCEAFKMDTLVNGSNPAFTTAVTQTTCGQNNGTITFTATGGTAPYQYSINGTTFQSGTVYTGLATGSYTVYVKDALGCYSLSTAVVTSKPRPVVTAFTVPATCNNNDGMIIATGTSGAAPYTYSLDGIVFQSSNTFTGLAAGFYIITIRDSTGCTNTTGVSVANLGAPVITLTSIVAAKCDNPNGSITITATGGTPAYEYTVNNLPYQASNIIAGLLPGTYTVYVKDVNGCIATKTVLVGNINGPQTLTAVIVHAACGLSNGSITAAATGGTAPLQYSKDGVTYQASGIFNALAAGAYTLYVRDANLCIKTLPVIILNLAGPSLTATSTPASCGLSDGTITAAATGGTGILTYSKDGITFQASNIFTGLAAGAYVITVKDARNCTATTNVTVNSTTVFTGTLAALAGGIQVCNSNTVSVPGTSYFDASCNLIARVVPSGGVPVNGVINTCVIIDGTVQFFNAEPYVQRHFDIEPVINANNATANITLYFRDEEFVEFNNNRTGFPALPTVAGGGNSDPNKNNVKVTQYHGVPIAPHNNGNPAAGYYSGNAGSGVLIVPSVNYNNTFNYWELTFPVTGFSGFYVHTNLHFPLPVTLAYFTGSKQSNGHLLNWQINCNSNTGVTINLERSGTGRNFSSIHTVTADSANCLQSFNYTDSSPLPGVNYYRLKITSAAGKIVYSGLVILINAASGVELISVNPNPVKDGYFTLSISSARNSLLEISVTDAQGSMVRRQLLTAIPGINRFPMEISKLASGLYIITVLAPNDKPKTIRLVKE